MKMDKKNTASAVAKMFPVAMNLVSHSWIAVAVVLPVSVVLLYASACMARAKHSSHARIRAGWRDRSIIYTVDCLFGGRPVNYLVRYCMIYLQ